MLCVLPQPESDSDCVAGGDADGDRRIVCCLVIRCLGGVPWVGWLGVSLSVTQKSPNSSRRRLLLSPPVLTWRKNGNSGDWDWPQHGHSAGGTAPRENAAGLLFAGLLFAGGSGLIFMTDMIAFIQRALAWYCARTASASSSVVALVKPVHSGSGGASIVRGGLVIVSGIS